MKHKLLFTLLLFITLPLFTYAQNNAEKAVWTGSGFAISDRYIATNYHVIDGAKRLKISGVNGDFNKSYTVSVVATDVNNDLAIIKVDDEQFKEFRNIPYTIYPNNVDVGTDVFVLGYPATIIMGQEVKITTGIINSRSGFQGDVSTYQMSATIQGGNSGGPVFDNDGNVVAVAVGGINREILQNIENVNYSVKSPYLINLIESCPEHISIPSSSRLKGLSLPARVKQISPFVVQITAYDDANSVSAPELKTQSGSDKERSDLLYARALESLKNGNIETAYSDVKAAVKLYPTAENHYLLGRLALGFVLDTTTNNHFKEDTNIAIKSFEYCVNAKYNTKECTHLLAQCNRMSNRYQDAIALYDRLLKEDKRDVDAYFGRALCKDAIGNPDGALRDYFDALEYEGIVNGDYGTIHNNIAYIYVQKGNYTLAKKHITEALKRNTLMDYIWSTDGELAYLQGEYSHCLSSMNNAITIGGNDTISLYFRGMAKAKLGDLWGAYRDLEDAKSMGCKRASAELPKIDMDNAIRKEHQRRVVFWPKTKGNRDNVLIKSIVLDEAYTAVTIQVYNTNRYQSTWYCISSKTNIKAGTYGTPVPLIHTQNCQICPQTNNLDANSGAEFVLYFPAINVPARTSIILTEEDENGSKGWNFSIKLENGTIEQAVKSNESKKPSSAHLGLRGVVGYFDGGINNYEYSATDYFECVFFGGRADLTFGKKGAIGLSVPLYLMNGNVSSGASVLVGYYDGLNMFTDLGVVLNNELDATFSWGFGMGYNKVNVNIEMLFGENFGFSGGIGIMF